MDFLSSFKKLIKREQPPAGPDLEEVWRIREEEVYPQLFDGEQRGVFTLSQALFSNLFKVEDIDPRWLFYGVFEFAPTHTRPFWLYVTSGLSNPWDQAPSTYDPNGPSGAGVEFLFASTQSGDWAIRFLQNMLAFDLLLTAGHFGDKPPLEAGDRIPLHSAIDGQDACQLDHAILWPATALPLTFRLPSGQVRFLTFAGLTGEEAAYARQTTTEDLVGRLMSQGQFPVTNPVRRSVI